jgi:hypothetical protein
MSGWLAIRGERIVCEQACLRADPNQFREGSEQIAGLYIRGPIRDDSAVQQRFEPWLIANRQDP